MKPSILPDEIIYSKRKTLCVSIDPFGKVIIRAPRSCSEEKIYAFLQDKEAWILKKKAEMMGAGIQLPPKNLDGYELLLLGNKCKICLAEIDKVGYDKDRNFIYLPLKNPKEILVKWLKENAKRIFSTAVEQTAKRMGTSYKFVRVTSARGRWGSCSAEDGVNFSFRLLYAPKDVIEYVVVHELAHTKHKNHSKAFWAEVAKYEPDWKEKRAWLKRHSGLMDVF